MGRPAAGLVLVVVGIEVEDGEELSTGFRAPWTART